MRLGRPRLLLRVPASKPRLQYKENVGTILHLYVPYRAYRAYLLVLADCCSGDAELMLRLYRKWQLLIGSKRWLTRSCLDIVCRIRAAALLVHISLSLSTHGYAPRHLRTSPPLYSRDIAVA